jgi:hypothetical protein
VTRPFLAVAASLAMASAASAAFALTPAKEDKVGSFTFTAKVAAERNVSDARARSFSNYKINRTLTVTCEMQAGSPSGVGPDGESTEQQALRSDASAAGEKAEKGFRGSAEADAKSLQKEVEACGSDQACQMRVAMKLMNDPRMQNVQEAGMQADKTMRPAMDRYASSIGAPVWQRWYPKVDSETCTGKLAVDDSETYDRGIDGEGGATSPGSMTMKGEAPIEGVHPDIWVNLEKGERQFLILVDSYAGEVTKQDTRSGRAPERLHVISGFGRKDLERLEIGPEKASTLGGTGEKTVNLDGTRAADGWRGTITLGWNFKP